MNPKSFRPITLSNVLTKGLERVIIWIIDRDTQLGNLENQFGFSKGKSTETAISKLVDKIESAVHRKQKALAVFFDI